MQSLLSDPNPSSPANQEAARLYAENRREYNRRVQQCATDSWKSVQSSEMEPAVSGPTATTENVPGPAESATSSQEAVANEPSESSSLNPETQEGEEGSGESRAS